MLTFLSLSVHAMMDWPWWLTPASYLLGTAWICIIHTFRCLIKLRSLARVQITRSTNDRTDFMARNMHFVTSALIQAFTFDALYWMLAHSLIRLSVVTKKTSIRADFSAWVLPPFSCIWDFRTGTAVASNHEKTHSDLSLPAACKKKNRCWFPQCNLRGTSWQKMSHTLELFSLQTWHVWNDTNSTDEWKFLPGTNWSEA